MAFTFQELADRARIPLNDDEKDRYLDAQLLTFGQDAYLLLRRYRPDIFLSGWGDFPAFGALTLAADFPSVDDMYLPVIADYIAARAEFRDDEAVVAERAQAFYALFAAGMRQA